MNRFSSMIVPLLLLTACGGEKEPAAAADRAEPPVAAAPEPAEPRRVLASSRIYYDLTRFEWYAHGEPLLHEQLAYQPVGRPLSASLEEMERAGEYRGVEFYRREGDDQSLYVPVYDGYWLSFRAAAPTARAD